MANRESLNDQLNRLPSESQMATVDQQVGMRRSLIMTRPGHGQRVAIVEFDQKCGLAFCNSSRSK